MDRISEDFCLAYFWGNPASLMLEKEHSKDHSLPAGRYVCDSHNLTSIYHTWDSSSPSISPSLMTLAKNIS